MASLHVKCFIVSHTHWDREWYRTFQTFRARLVDMIDRVLELIERDPGFHFLLDGQTIVLEDYLAIRPERRAALTEACRAERVAIGPWYVQPDSLLPSGEAHVRNLLEGRRGGSAIGPVSRVAYTPDSFGHPAQFPQLFRGFGLEPFVYWRGNGNEIDTLPAEYLWEGADGGAVLVHHLSEGYFSACGLPANTEAAATFLAGVARTLAERTRNDAVLLMNGIDHALPDAHVGAAADQLARATGWSVQRGLLETFAGVLSHDAPRFRGELVGARVANLLPGVWSTRTPLKLRNRRIEALLEGWAEPWCAIGRAITRDSGRAGGVPDERPALRLAWRALLQNQAHDSICGCSHDRVHEQMQARYDAAEELAEETMRRVLERLAGLGVERRTPAGQTFDLAVFNPSPHTRTDVVRFTIDPATWFEFGGETARTMSLHPWLRASIDTAGYTVNGEPARLIADAAPGRQRLMPDLLPRSIEFVARDIPAFGWRRFTVEPSAAHGEHEDDGREIACGDLWVCAADDGTFALRSSRGVYTGLCGIEDLGDRGDSYDFDPVPGGTVALERVEIRRRVHPSGIQHLTVRRTVRVPAELAPDRGGRSAGCVPLTLETEARVAPGVAYVAVRVGVDNTAKDHRLRLLFPTGRAATEFDAATTFDVARRHTRRPDDSGWVHPAPATFVQHGWVCVNNLTVAAPGLPEAEVTPAGVVAITLVRSVGWLARMDLTTRPQPAGPVVETPGAQCQGPIEARLALFAGADPRAARDAELGLRAVAAGDTPNVPPDRPLLLIQPRELVLSTLKPAAEGDGLILRVLNPTDAAVDARIRVGLPFSRVDAVRLDEAPADGAVAVDDNQISLTIPPHGLRSVRVSGGGGVLQGRPT
jgi:mannosylglycerate hydrolase